MAIVDFAVRLAMVRALRGQTYVGDNVLDTPVNPETYVLQEISDNNIKARPLIAVYANTSISKGKGRDLSGHDHGVEITTQIYLPYDGVEIPVTSGTVAIKGNSEGSLFLSDLISRQVYEVMQYRATPWASMLRELLVDVEEVRRQSFIMATTSKFEIAAREIVFKCGTCAEPSFGRINDFWQSFINLVAATTDIAPLAPVLSKALSGAAGDDWQAIMSDIGTLQNVLPGLGLTLGFVNPAEDGVPLTEVNVSNEDDGSFVVS